VAFGDVNLSEEQIRGNYNPGAGGWPTIRYFNQKTGYEGAPYTKKTDKAMCDELGSEENMQAYVEEAGSTSLCKVSDGAGCGEKELDFIAKWKEAEPKDTAAQLERLQGMSASKMKPELQKWLGQRMAILKQLVPKDEL
jgi:hypothetical protein